MNALKAEHQTALDAVKAKEAEVDNFQGRIGTWYQENNSKFTETQKALEQARIREAQAVERIKRLGSQYGIPDEELKDFTAAPAHTPPPAPDPNAFDPKQYMTRQELIREAQALPLISAELQELSEEHRELFGKPLRGSAELIKDAQKRGVSLRQAWEEKNKVSERRAQVQEEAVQKRISDTVAERETKIRSELQLPTPRPDQPRSAIVEKFSVGKAPDTRDPSRGVRAALAAYNERKYSPAP
jgi:hypothetical protein